MSHTPSHAYGRALDALAAAVRDAHAIAALLEYAAGVLRSGRPADLDGPPLDQIPGGARVLAVLARRDRALVEAERVWEGLASSVREGLQAPGELLEEARCA
jgi:hypothetical protein